MEEAGEFESFSGVRKIYGNFLQIETIPIVPISGIVANFDTPIDTENNDSPRIQ